jgi:hypothetical protein
MDVKTTRRFLWFPALATSVVAVTLSAHAGLIRQDSFETSAFSALWNRTEGATIHNSGGANATHGFASLNPNGGELGGNFVLPSNPSGGTSDFSIEFFLRTHDATQGRFSLQIQGSEISAAVPALNICYDAAKGWGISSGSNGVISRHLITEMKTISPNAWYRFRLIARDWGETNARCNLQLSDAGNTFALSATNLVCFQSSPALPQTALHFTLVNTAHGNSGLDVDEVRIADIRPYKGPVVRDVDTKTLLGKVMCGYQGWFGAPNDGSPERGWRHWTKNGGPLEDGNAKVDLWPDVSELDESQRFLTGFKTEGGSPAKVFSSFQRPTVLKHFQWMQDYGIDGVFVQRFANGLKNPTSLEHCNTVLANCRDGANIRGRTYAVMYDLSGLPAGHIDDVIDDWRALRTEMAITEDPAYLNHRGKPVVAVWGIGFNDDRDYTLAECRRLIEFFKNDPDAGGCTVMLGVPAHWRELKEDAVSDPALLEIIALADIVSPWTVGRYTTAAEAASYTENILKPDLAWCSKRGLDFLPVVFPGFSWHNMKGGPSGQIPRLRGRFLWSQFCAAKKANASMVYVAMFDEVDEGTAIFKCVNDVPIGQKSKFVTWEGLPSDFYLKMVGAGTKLIRGDGSLENKENKFSFFQQD